MIFSAIYVFSSLLKDAKTSECMRSTTITGPGNIYVGRAIVDHEAWPKCIFDPLKVALQTVRKQL